MTAPQQEHVTILPPKRIKRRHTRRWMAAVAILIILLLAMAAIGGTLLHHKHQANSFPTLHAQGSDPVLQLQALYNEPDHAEQALKKGNNTHIKSQADGSGMAIRTLYVDIDTTDPAGNKLTINIGKPNRLDNGDIANTTILNGGDGPFIYLEQDHPTTSPDSDKKWQRTTHMSKKQGIKLVDKWVRTVLNTAADNW